MKPVIAVDIGGTKISVGLVNEQGEVLHRVSRASLTENAQMMFQGLILAVEQLLEETNQTISDVYGMGLGVPGKVDREKGIAVFQNNLPWANFPLVDKLKDYFPLERIVIDNDVYQAAFAEWKTANLEKEELMVYCTISTGIACSIIQDGQFLRGAGFAGEIGFLPFSPFGEINRLEPNASGGGLAKKAQAVYQDENMTAEELYQKFYEKDERASALVEEQAQSIAFSLYSLVCLIDPHKMVLGGSVVTENPSILSLIKKYLDKFLVPDQKESLQGLSVSTFTTEPGLIGAGLSVYNAFKED